MCCVTDKHVCCDVSREKWKRNTFLLGVNPTQGFLEQFWCKISRVTWLLIQASCSCILLPKTHMLNTRILFTS